MSEYPYDYVACLSDLMNCGCSGEMDPERLGSGIQYGNASLRRLNRQHTQPAQPCSCSAPPATPPSSAPPPTNHHQLASLIERCKDAINTWNNVIFFFFFLFDFFIICCLCCSVVVRCILRLDAS